VLRVSVYMQIIIDETVTLNRNVPIPLYYQLKQYILDRIQNGQWMVGFTIPTEQQFCEIFGISRPTVRQAVNELVAEGHLNKLNRRVTVASPKLHSSFFERLQSFNTEMRRKNLTPKTRVLNLEIRENEDAAEKLRLSDARCVFLKRLRSVDDIPVVLIETYLPYGSMSDLLSQDFTNISLYETIEERYKIQISRVERFFEATLAGTVESEALSIKKGSPICFVETTAYDQRDNPIEFSVARYGGEKSRFHVSISR